MKKHILCFGLILIWTHGHATSFKRMIFGYAQELQTASNGRLLLLQKKIILRNLKERSYPLLTKVEIQFKRKEYQQIRNRLIKDWEKMTLQKWPNGWSLHHIIHTSHGGLNEWWNVIPIPVDRHMAIHQSETFCEKIHKKSNKSP